MKTYANIFARNANERSLAYRALLQARTPTDAFDFALVEARSFLTGLPRATEVTASASAKAATAMRAVSGRLGECI
jgi:hypothetical protein